MRHLHTFACMCLVLLCLVCAARMCCFCDIRGLAPAAPSPHAAVLPPPPCPAPTASTDANRLEPTANCHQHQRTRRSSAAPTRTITHMAPEASARGHPQQSSRCLLLWCGVARAPERQQALPRDALCGRIVSSMQPAGSCCSSCPASRPLAPSAAAAAVQLPGSYRPGAAHLQPAALHPATTGAGPAPSSNSRRYQQYLSQSLLVWGRRLRHPRRKLGQRQASAPIPGLCLLTRLLLLLLLPAAVLRPAAACARGPPSGPVSV